MCVCDTRRTAGEIVRPRRDPAGRRQAPRGAARTAPGVNSSSRVTRESQGSLIIEIYFLVE